MKVQNPQDFLKHTRPELRSLLVYGSNRGLVRDIAQQTAALYCDDMDDPFQTAVFDESSLADDPVRFAEEAITPSLLGSRRFVWLRFCPEGLAKTIMETVNSVATQSDPASFILIECGELRPTSVFRKAFEAKGHALQAIACYEDTPQNLAKFISDLLMSNGLKIDRDALALLSDQSTGDRHIARRMVEKLTTYAGEATQLSFQDIEACASDGARLDLADAVSAIASGQAARADDLVLRLISRGETAIGLLRMTQSHFRKLELVALAMTEGKSADSAIDTLRPPVFFRRKPEMLRQAKNLSLRQIRISLKSLFDAERLCKRSDIPVEAVLTQTLTRIASACGQR